jgi:hypothetical protein
MFSQDISSALLVENNTNESESIEQKYKNVAVTTVNSSNEINYNAIDALLEREKQNNKNENWSKLDKTVKIQKLHEFAEKYGRENSLPVKDIKLLKQFFKDCLEKNKLQKTKDVSYDKDTKEISGIPALHFNNSTRNFTLKIIDTKRVSTLKSLTPKRTEDPEMKN